MASSSKTNASGGVIRAAVKKRSISFQGDTVIDWDAVYSDLLDSGMSSEDAATKLDEYMIEAGHPL